MKVLVINAGSSSLKYQLIDMTTEQVLAKGNCERIGTQESFLTHRIANGQEKKLTIDMNDHFEAFMQVKAMLIDPEVGVITALSEVVAIGHRVVQGGAIFKESMLINDAVLKGIESLIPLAPLHNSAHVQGIRACMAVFGPHVPEVAVFDTSFHSTMPPRAYMFPIPYEYYKKYDIRRYGFHGTSHRYVSQRCAELINQPIDGLKIITCHLGNGSSITAIDHGKVIDTSMGFTPLDGFMMGTRTGTLDPSVVTFLAEKECLSLTELNDLFNKKSGLLGISGVSSDDRDVCAAIEQGNVRAILAHDMLCYGILKFIGSYAAALNGCNALVFTGGLGENQSSHRARICENLAYLGVKISPVLNDQAIRGKECKISSAESKVNVFVIPTNEEIIIARDTRDIVQAI